MIITTKTAVMFQLPEEKELMEQFERDNSDWVMDSLTTNTVTYRRTQIFQIGGDKHETDERPRSATLFGEI